MNIIHLDLNGHWRFRSPDHPFAGEATVPGTIHTDLLKNRLIEDPFFGDNEAGQIWIGEREWIYHRTFTADAGLRARKHIRLVCEGLDTLAMVSLNGLPLGRTENMFRRYAFDIKANLREGENELEIRFSSAVLEGQKLQHRRQVRCHGADGTWRIDGGQFLRKTQSNFGWDWGPKCVTCGIWRPIYIEAWDGERLEHVSIAQSHQEGRVEIRIRAEIESDTTPHNLALRATLTLGGASVAETKLTVQERAGTGVLELARPHLWWPNGWGEQPLYQLEIVLEDIDGTVLDRKNKRIGLRMIEVVREPDENGRSFYFRVNGTPIFAKGANWIPADVFVPRLESAFYTHLLESAQDANMNCIRVWGGGIYECDQFYDLCDELGLLVWQDFMFACSAYPAFDPEFLENVRQEAVFQVRRLHHHPCIALYCGNNELEQFTELISEDGTNGAMTRTEYDRLFNRLLPEAVAQGHPGAFYWPCSAHSENSIDANDCATGDVHYWGVWWGLAPFESYTRLRPRFCSEFGFQSFPHPATIDAFIVPEERNLTSYSMDFHQRGNTAIGSGNGTILAYLSDHFRIPKDYEHLLIMSQIIQGYGLQIAVEGWRMMRPHCMGSLYWQLNDCWPGPSWATIDSLGRWKASHYLAKRFFAPVIVTGVVSGSSSTLTVRVISDPEIGGDLELRVTVTDLAGEIINEWAQTAAMHHQCPAVATFSLDETSATLRHRLYWLKAVQKGRILATGLAHGVRFKHLQLKDPGLSLTIEHESDQTYARITACQACSLFTWLDATPPIRRFEDNFFHLMRGQTRRIQLPDTETCGLRASSLFDTYVSRKSDDADSGHRVS